MPQVPHHRPIHSCIPLLCKRSDNVTTRWHASQSLRHVTQWREGHAVSKPRSNFASSLKLRVHCLWFHFGTLHGHWMIQGEGDGSFLIDAPRAFVSAGQNIVERSDSAKSSPQTKRVWGLNSIWQRSSSRTYLAMSYSVLAQASLPPFYFLVACNHHREPARMQKCQLGTDGLK